LEDLAPGLNALPSLFSVLVSLLGLGKDRLWFGLVTAWRLEVQINYISIRISSPFVQEPIRKLQNQNVGVTCTIPKAALL
jgi:hypothetical protein